MSNQARAKTTTWMGEVPSHWDVKALKYCADLVTDRVNGSDVDSFYIGLEHIESKTGRLIREDGSQENAESTVNCFLRDDVLFGKLRPYLAKAAVTESNGVCSSEILVYRPHGLTPQYLKHVMLLEGFIEEVNASTYGSKMPRADAAFISRLPVPQPPIDEQIAIAAYLDTETNRVDVLIEEKRKLLNLLDELRKTSIRSAVTHGLDTHVSMIDSKIPYVGKVPKHWVVCHLKRVFDVLDGKRVPLSSTERSEFKGEFPYYGASGIIDYVKDYIFNETTVLVSEDGANLVSRSTPIAFTAHGKYWVNNHAHILRPMDSAFEFWSERIESVNLMPFISGSAQPKLTVEALCNLVISYPPDEEERLKINQFIIDERAKINPLVNLVNREIDCLLELRSSTITDAVLGRIDVRKAQAH